MASRSYVPGIMSLLAAAGLLASPAALAQTLNGQTVTPEYLAEVMAAHEMPAEFVDIEDAEGPTLAAMAGDFTFLASFEACDEDGEECEIVVLRCGLALAPSDQPDLSRINLWNHDFWGKAFIDEDGDPWISLELNVKGGVAEENLSDTLIWWASLIGEFADFVGYDT
jgi:hypothetical protein